jgi:cardiolipin synthase A/B
MIQYYTILQVNWFLFAEIIYTIIVILVCFRIIYDTHTSVKTLAYLLFCIFVPFLGILFYFSFGMNYRKKELYSKKIINDDNLWEKIKKDIDTYSKETYDKTEKFFRPNRHLAKYLSNEMSPLTSGNSAQILVNGEEKFPAVIKALEEAQDHIHIEYYIYENDKIGRAIEEVLVKKAKQGVRVKFIYDDFGSKGIRKNIARRLRTEGVEAYPFYKIKLLILANRLNYRNHRKIIVIDGKKAFVGGINVSDRYINDQPPGKKLFWRDTHIVLEGPCVHYLQYLFISDWNFCAPKNLENVTKYFSHFLQPKYFGNKLVQFAASGPDSRSPTILYSLLYAIYQAEEEILITTPYFIPEQSILDALVVASLGGVSVKLLVPKKSDSKLVELAANSYYEDLLDAGAKLFLYKKGFVHAKTMVVDKKMAIVGTANMDYRSFDLNFEVNAIVHNTELAGELANIFSEDVKNAEEVDAEKWKTRPRYKQLVENTVRLISPLL